MLKRKLPTPAEIGSATRLENFDRHWQATGKTYSEQRVEIKRRVRPTRVFTMHISSTISTQFGARRAFEPMPIVIPTDPAAALVFALRVDREADAELQAGHIHQAERLSHLALEARCRATGARA